MRSLAAPFALLLLCGIAVGQIAISGVSCCCGRPTGAAYQTTATASTPCSSTLYAHLQSHQKSITCLSSRNDALLVGAANGTLNLTSNSQDACWLYPLTCNTAVSLSSWERYWHVTISYVWNEQ